MHSGMILAAVCSLTISTLVAGPLCARQRANIPLPTPGIPNSLGVNIHFNTPRPGEMEQLAAGFRWIRQDFSWAGIEREKGRYDFSAYERLLAALKPYKIRPIFILDYGNDLYEQGSPRSPESRAAFARFAAAAVSHFKNRGILWEMWNEPNIGFWLPRPNVDEYIALALATGKAIREAAPNEWFIGPGVSGMDLPFIERCCKAGLLAYWNAVSFHPYRDSLPETASEDYRKLREILDRYSPHANPTLPDIPILASEWGYSELYSGLSLEKQSRYIVREYLTNLLNGLLITIWYDWHDDGTDPKEPEHHFGTVYNDYRPKPTYTSAQTLAKHLHGFCFNKRLALDSPDDYCLLFSNGAAQRLVAWTMDSKPHEVEIPTSAGTFEVVTYLGATSEVQAQANGLHLTLTDAPQYLIPRRSNALLTLAAVWRTVPATLYMPGTRNSVFATDRQDEGSLDSIAFWLAETANPMASRRLPDNGVGTPLTESVYPGIPRPLNAQLTLRTVNRRGALQVAGGQAQEKTETLSHFTIKLQSNTSAEARNELPLIVRAALRIDGVGTVAQEFEVRARDPLRVTVLPAVGATLPVRVENPNGVPFIGRIELTQPHDSPTAPIRFAAGETECTVVFPFPQSAAGEYAVACAISEQRGGKGPWNVVVRMPTQRLTPLESFDAYAPGASLPAAEYQIVPDGDPKVKSQITGAVVDAPAGLPGAGEHALRIAYEFDKGWKFLRLARTLDLPGKPYALGMWVYGDGSGDILRARFTDATGQTFQPDGGSVDWRGWRYVTFPLQGEVGGHWGGADDGVIHYPIHLDTPLLVDSPGGRGSRGTVYVTGITLIHRD